MKNDEQPEQVPLVKAVGELNTAFKELWQCYERELFIPVAFWLVPVTFWVANLLDRVLGKDD